MEPVWWTVEAPALQAPVGVCVLDPDLPRTGARTWLLHGRGCTGEDVDGVLRGLGTAMASGRVAPQVLLAPLAPWLGGASWWVDSAGFPLETSVLGEVLPQVEARLGLTPGLRRVGGWSMGGAPALRWLLTRPDLFSAAALVAPAVATDLPPTGSSARWSVFGADGASWDEERYRTLLGRRSPVDPAARPRVVTVVGDDEPVEDYPSGPSSLTAQAVLLHLALQGAGVASRLRVVGGGHEPALWAEAFTVALGLLDP